MRSAVPERLEAGRIREGLQGSTSDWGFNGAFIVHGPCGEYLRIIISAGAADDTVSHGWQHVSVSTRRRPPNWQEMCFVKNLCWDEEELVLQFHPPRSQYVNNHRFVLHMWKAPYDVPLPPSILVGYKELGTLGP